MSPDLDRIPSTAQLRSVCVAASDPLSRRSRANGSGWSTSTGSGWPSALTGSDISGLSSCCASDIDLEVLRAVARIARAAASTRCDRSNDSGVFVRIMRTRRESGQRIMRCRADCDAVSRHQAVAIRIVSAQTGSSGLFFQTTRSTGGEIADHCDPHVPQPVTEVAFGAALKMCKRITRPGDRPGRVLVHGREPRLARGITAGPEPQP